MSDGASAQQDRLADMATVGRQDEYNPKRRLTAEDKINESRI